MPSCRQTLALVVHRVLQLILVAKQLLNVRLVEVAARRQVDQLVVVEDEHRRRQRRDLVGFVVDSEVVVLEGDLYGRLLHLLNGLSTALKEHGGDRRKGTDGSAERGGNHANPRVTHINSSFPAVREPGARS